MVDKTPSLPLRPMLRSPQPHMSDAGGPRTVSGTPRQLNPEHLHHLVAEVVDDLDSYAACRGNGERTRDVAVYRLPRLRVDLRLERVAQRLVGVLPRIISPSMTTSMSGSPKMTNRFPEGAAVPAKIGEPPKSHNPAQPHPKYAIMYIKCSLTTIAAPTIQMVGSAMMQICSFEM